MITRRHFVARVAGLAALGAAGTQLWAQFPGLRTGPTPITVYKTSGCLCCAKWVDHLRASGFAPSTHDEEGLDALKDKLGVPKAVRSCHVAQVEGYVIEGHVPAADIRRLLTERPKVAGLAVPGMPSHTPGMAEPGDKIEGFEVVAFQSDGATKAFTRY